MSIEHLVPMNGHMVALREPGMTRAMHACVMRPSRGLGTSCARFPLSHGRSYPSDTGDAPAEKAPGARSSS